MEGKYIRWLKIPPDYSPAINNDFVDRITEWTPGFKSLDRFLTIHHELEQITPNIYKCHGGFFRIYDTKEQALDPPYDFKVGDKVKLISELHELYKYYKEYPLYTDTIYTINIIGSYKWDIGFQKCLALKEWCNGYMPQECFTKVESKPFETDFNVGDTVKVVDRLLGYTSHPKAIKYGCDKYAGEKEFPETLTIKKLLYINDSEPGTIITDGEWDWLVGIKGIVKVDPSIPEDPYKVFKDAIAEGKIIQCKNTISNKWNERKNSNWEFDSPPESYRIKPEESEIFPMSDGIIPEAGMWIYNFANSSIYRLTGERDEEGYWKYDESVQVAKGSYAAIEENDSFWRKATNLEVAQYVQKHHLWKHLEGKLDFLVGLYVSFDKKTFGVTPGSYLINEVNNTCFIFGSINFISHRIDALEHAELSFSEVFMKEESIKKEPVMESKLPDWVFPGVIFWEKNNHNAIRTVISVKGNLFHSTTFLYPDEYLSGDAIWDINSINSFGYEPMPYDLAQKRWIETRGIKEGDTVKVVRKCETQFLGWNNPWIDAMIVGGIHQITYFSRDIHLSDSHGYPYFCLEKVESNVLEKPTPISEPDYPSIKPSVNRAALKEEYKFKEIKEPIIKIKKTNKLINKPDPFRVIN